MDRPRLQSLVFEITSRCNHACLHCYNIWTSPNPFQRSWRGETRNLNFTGELDTARTIALLTKVLNEIDCPHITITGGEPLLRRDLAVIVNFLQELGKGITIITNGHLLNERAAIDLLRNGARLFEIPLLSYRREVHDELSGARENPRITGAFDAALAAMAYVHSHGGQFVAVFVATRLNLPDLYDTIRLAYAFGARGVMLNRFNVGGRGITHMKELLPSSEELRDALAVAEAAAVEFGYSISCSIPIQPCLIDTRAFPHLGFGYCAAGTERAYYTLDPVGNLRPCNHTNTVLGNLFDESFTDLIHPSRLDGFCQSIPEFCLPCSLRERCQGGCKAAAEACYGSLSAEEPFLRFNRAYG